MTAVLAAVHEDVELPGVGVEVAVHGHHPLLQTGRTRVQTVQYEYTMTPLPILNKLNRLAHEKSPIFPLGGEWGDFWSI